MTMEATWASIMKKSWRWKISRHCTFEEKELKMLVNFLRQFVEKWGKGDRGGGGHTIRSQNPVGPFKDLAGPVQCATVQCA